MQNETFIYLSGKITGQANYKELFEEARKDAEDKFPGATIINPAEINLPKMCDWEDYMSICLRLLDKANIIYLLDNWLESKGARKEYITAFKKGLKVYLQTYSRRIENE
jgi:hypothetical protein